MTEEEIAEVLHQHLRVPDDYAFWLCKCGEKRQHRRRDVRRWHEHVAQVLAEALGGAR